MASVPADGLMITYSVEPAGPVGFVRLHLRVQWRQHPDSPGLAFDGVTLMAAQNHIPTSSADGVELYRWMPARLDEPGDFEASVSLAPGRDEGWHEFYCKLFVLDADGRRILIVHPNTCRAFLIDGQLAGSKPPLPPLRYEKGEPRTLVCPTCFEEFSVSRMLFAFDPNGPAISARRSWIDRVRRRNRLRTPVDAKGRRAVYCFCPQMHRLPASAGTQSSLIVGLIGAKYSGKTHYIRSLIECLKNRCAIDDCLTLLAANEETEKHFSADRIKLFKRGEQLDVTVGQPPPLIYDVAYSVKPVVRRVTLSLYDTAGENLDDARTAEQMVRYVRVAAGLMLLIDPLQIPKVRNRVPENELPSLNPKASPAEILTSVLEPLHQHKLIPQNGPLPIPVAVVLTKCDVLRKHRLFEAGRLWGFPEYRHNELFRSPLHKDMSAMIGEQLREWVPEAFGIVTNRFPNHSFFGASATGAAADAFGRFASVKPYRVEDPLLWLLSELGVFPMEDSV